MTSLVSEHRPAPGAPFLHFDLYIVRHAAAVWQKSPDIQTAGPTASLAATVFVVPPGAGLIALLCKGAETAYMLLSLVGLAMSVLAIYGGFTRDQSDWPSEFWRWAGIIVHPVGVAGFMLALAAFIRRKSLKS